MFKFNPETLLPKIWINSLLFFVADIVNEYKCYGLREDKGHYFHATKTIYLIDDIMIISLWKL